MDTCRAKRIRMYHPKERGRSRDSKPASGRKKLFFDNSELANLGDLVPSGRLIHCCDKDVSCLFGKSQSRSIPAFLSSRVMRFTIPRRSLLTERLAGLAGILRELHWLGPDRVA